jgi:hypothetical protein
MYREKNLFFITVYAETTLTGKIERKRIILPY